MAWVNVIDLASSLTPTNDLGDIVIGADRFTAPGRYAVEPSGACAASSGQHIVAELPPGVQYTGRSRLVIHSNTLYSAYTHHVWLQREYDVYPTPPGTYEFEADWIPCLTETGGTVYIHVGIENGGGGEGEVTFSVEFEVDAVVECFWTKQVNVKEEC